MNNRIIFIVLAFLVLFMAIFNPLIFGTIAFVFWVFLGVNLMRKRSVFRDKWIAGMSQKNYKRLRTCMVTGIVTYLVSVVSVFLHNYISGRSGSEEAVFFFIGIIALYLFIVLSAFGVSLISRSKPG